VAVGCEALPYWAQERRARRPPACRNGVLDTKPDAQVLDRSWTFRTVGFGHGEELWRRLLGTLVAVGSCSIEIAPS
jgi:hypothetical protein